MAEYDVCVIGGGLLGSAFGWGLVREGQRCVVLDEGDGAIRTARGNFGLVWLQSKGRGMPEYARWTLEATRIWGGFADELKDITGIDLHYAKGGYNIGADEAELAQMVANLNQIQSEMGDDAYDYEVLDQARLKREMPLVGDVAGATYTAHDGHCNPLLLLRAMQQAFQAKGGAYRPNSGVRSVEILPGGGFRILGQNGAELARAAKVVLSAGHGSARLAKDLGIDLPIHPEQGQVLVTEKVAPVMPHPAMSVRQTDNGSFLLGASKKEVDLDTRTDLETLATIAASCIRLFPFLGRLRLQRAWGALRVMTPDGHPVYQQSESHPGLFSFACHSGVTLAACHALHVSKWVIDGTIPDTYSAFHPRRFHV
ncbi:MAG: FAD-binding oxidoreductase [Rhodobacterales bacterium]|nr:FAD-binding oxidoreductase [Rhodobacterales bacterium]